MAAKTSKLVESNPFYKMSSTLDLFQQGNKLSDTTVTQQQVYRYLDAAWSECNTKEKKELFYVLVFSLGDMSNREHNVFRRRGIKTPDTGGQSKRRVFMYCLKWMLERAPVQFYTFLPIIGEYYNLGGIMFYQLKTDRYKGTLQEVLKLDVGINPVTDYITKVLKATTTTENEKMLWARWLPHVPNSSRIRKYVITDKNIKAFKKNEKYADAKVGDSITVKKEKKEHTKQKDAWVIDFIKALSAKMDWKITKMKGGLHFEGYRQFRKTYLSETEAVKFSAHLDDPRSVTFMDKTQFMDWLDTLPSEARYRVACRICSKDKAGTLSPRDKWKLKSGENCGAVYIQWLADKQKAQTKLASLTTEEKEKMTTKELQQVQKAAKVNVAGDVLIDLIAEIASRKLTPAEMDVKAFSLLEKIILQVPVLVASDISGSMAMRAVSHKGSEFSANALCQLATTVFLLKNPDAEAGEFLVRFGSSADVVAAGTKSETNGRNKFMSTKVTTVDVLVDRTKPFSWNLSNISKYIGTPHGSTNFSAIPDALKIWVDEEPAFSSQRIDMINRYKVILAMSDGEFNSSYSPTSSFLEFQNKMRQWFGWEGVTVIWDVKEGSVGDGKKFQDIPNIMYFGGCNMGVLNQVFTNIHDLDIIDAFLPLKTLHASNRYQPVKELVL